MQNTFSQSGNDSKWFLTKIIFQNSLMANETPSRPPPPPFMANTILNFHFDYLHPSLSEWVYIGMKMIALWSNRNCMRSANLNIFYIWVESWQHVHSIWKCGHWYWTSPLAGMQITTLTRLTYKCAHLRSTKESLTIEYKEIILDVLGEFF